MLVHTLSGVHGFTDSGVHGFRGSRFQGFTVSGFLGLRGSRFKFETMHCIDIKKVLPKGKRSSGGGAEPVLSEFPIFHSFHCHY